MQAWKAPIEQQWKTRDSPIPSAKLRIYSIIIPDRKSTPLRIRDEFLSIFPCNTKRVLPGAYRALQRQRTGPARTRPNVTNFVTHTTVQPRQLCGPDVASCRESLAILAFLRTLSAGHLLPLLLPILTRHLKPGIARPIDDISHQPRPSHRFQNG